MVKRKGYMIGLLGLVVILLAGCISIPLGDGNKLKVSKDGIQFTDGDGKQTDISLSDDGIDITDSEGGEHSLTLDEESGTVSFKGEGEDGNTEWTFGEGADLPEGFPDEIPLVDDAKVMHSVSASGGTSVMYTSALSSEEVNKLYEAYVDKYGNNVERSKLEFDYGVVYMYVGEISYGNLAITISPADTDEAVSIVAIEVNAPSE